MDVEGVSTARRVVAYFRLHKFMVRELNKAVEQMDMMMEIEAQYEKSVRAMQQEYDDYDDLLDPVTDPKIELVPPTPDDLALSDLLNEKWMRQSKDEL